MIILDSISICMKQTSNFSLSGFTELKTPRQRGVVPSSRDPPHSSSEHLVNPLHPQGQNRLGYITETLEPQQMLQRKYSSCNHKMQHIQHLIGMKDLKVSPVSLSAVRSSYASISPTSYSAYINRNKKERKNDRKKEYVHVLRISLSLSLWRASLLAVSLHICI